MNYETFKEHILSNLAKELPFATLSIQPIIKNNDVTLDGLVIMESDTNISPTLYLDYYYELYKNGSEFESILQNILDTYHANQPDGRIDISFFTNYHNIEPKIVFKLINYKKNKNLLENVPHIRFLDLAIVFYCLISTSLTGNATILIRNSHMHYWGITKQELYEKTKENTPSLLPYDFRTMNDIIKELMNNPSETIDLKKEDTVLPMYVLTNKNKLNGASCILYSDLLFSFSKKFNSDFYILPSSIHEVILVPANGDNTSFAELTQMVQDVNDSQLAEEEILSDHAYYFSRSTKLISM